MKEPETAQFVEPVKSRIFCRELELMIPIMTKIRKQPLSFTHFVKSEVDTVWSDDER